MPPRGRLDRSKTKGGKLCRQRIHADFRIDEHVQICPTNRVDPGLQVLRAILRAILEMVDLTPHSRRLFIGAAAQMEQPYFEPCPVQMTDPPLGDRVPDRVVSD